MAVSENKKRLNVTLSSELAEWIGKQAESYGCSVSSMIALAIGQYKQQVESLQVMKEIGGLQAFMQQVIDEGKIGEGEGV